MPGRKTRKLGGGRVQRQQTVTGEEQICQEGRGGGVKKGQVEQEESSEEMTGEHKPKGKDRREDRWRKENLGWEVKMSGEEKTREEIMGEESKE